MKGIDILADKDTEWRRGIKIEVNGREKSL